MSNSIPEIEDSDCLLIFGYNGADSHPIVARRIVRAKEKGCHLIVVDPRMTESARIADNWVDLKGGSNMALVNAFGNVLINEELYDKEFVKKNVNGFEEYKAIVEKYTPEYAEKITGISANHIRRTMREYAKAKDAMILYGMGVCQFGQAVDVVKGLASLALLTGNFGRESVGIGPVRGQNNVQGACDMGVLPNVYPGYQSVANEDVRKKFEKAWGAKLSNKPGFVLSEIPKLVLEDKKVKAYYIFGEDPVQSEPDSAEVREALDELELVIVQDIFMNRTALHADVILPATAWGEHEGVFTCADRGFQRMRKAVEPQGDVKVDWEIISEISTAMGYPMKYKNTEEIWDEMRSLCPNFAGASYKKMEEQGGVQWPCPTEDHPGTKYLYEGEKFSNPDGKGNLFASEWRAPIEQPNEEYPMVLCTVREVGHYSARTMSGNCRGLRELADEPGRTQLNVKDAERLGIKDQEIIRISSRRGSVLSRADVTERVKEGNIFMTYQWWVGACNELTLGTNLDPVTKTPEYKYCAANVEKIEDQEAAEQQVIDEYNELKEQMNVTPKA